MKRFFAIVLFFALMLGLLPAGAAAQTGVPTTCQACGTAQTWEVMPASWADLTAGHYHFYLSGNVTPGQLSTPKDVEVTICLDLNGYNINTDGRAMIAYSKGVLNIMDSSSSAEGYVCGSTGKNNTASGTIAVTNGGTLRLHSGTLKFKKDDIGLGVCRSGVVGIEKGGAMEMLGGRIEGGELVMTSSISTDPGCGAAIYMAGGTTLSISGGEITSGSCPEGGEGPCVFLAGTTAKVTLTGTAKVAEICSKALNNITVTGTYTGKATVCYTDAVAVANGTVIGNAAGADISGAELFCSNGDGYEIQKSGDNLVVRAFASTAERHICKHCNTIVDWMPVSGNTGLFATAGQHHLYLTADYTGKQLNAKDGATVCLDLYGKNVYTDGRSFHVGANGQLNLMDTIGGSTVTGTSGSNNPTGGALAINGDNAVCNIYDGTYKMVQDGTGYGVGTGGVMYISKGTLNFYDGKIEGGDLVISGYELTTNGYGAAIYMAGTTQLNVYGGEILSGTVPQGGLGECVYMDNVNAKVSLSGDASVEEIYCKKDTKPITVIGTYTGTVAIRFPAEQTIFDDVPVGVCTGADLSAAKLTCVNGDGYYLVNKNGVLVTSSFGLDAVAAAYNSDGAVGFKTLQEAIDACTDGYVKLLKTTDQTGVVQKDLYLNMNGQSATLTISEGVTVYGFDSQTNDYTVADGKYGKLTVTGGKVAGLPEESGFAEDGYLRVEEQGAYSFHRVKLQIYAMSLRSDAAGIYYKSHFLADEKAAAQIESYGVALSISAAPTEENLEEIGVLSVFEGFESGAVGNIGNASSTLLKGVLKETNSESKNRRTLNMPVYGRAYAKIADGQLLLGQPVERSLAQQLQAVDGMLPGLSDVQAQAAAKLYTQYENLFGEMELNNLAAVAQKEEKGTLKVLSLGHSHGLDGTALLYEVLDAELTDQQVVVGALYYSGCSMESHAKFLTNNQPEYDYYKKDNTNVDGAWTIKKRTTGLYALQDEQWDVIVIQDANFRAGREEIYIVSHYMTVLNYLYNNQEIKPRILFHMTWTNPDDYDTYINASSGLSHPNQSWYRPYMEQYYSDADGVFQREILIDKILTYTEKYLEDCTEFLGEKHIESIIPAATAVEYAQYVCGRTDKEIYRDWTHMNDYGRLIVAYTWYAKIMQLDQIDEIKVYEVPTGAHHSNSKFPADLKFDEQMRADALASVNFALANPYLDIANGDPIPEN